MFEYIGKEVFFINYICSSQIEIDSIKVVSVSRTSLFDSKGKSIKIESVFNTLEEASVFLGQELKKYKEIQTSLEDFNETN